jgi:hypothetical protein
VRGGRQDPSSAGSVVLSHTVYWGCAGLNYLDRLDRNGLWDSERSQLMSTSLSFPQVFMNALLFSASMVQRNRESNLSRSSWYSTRPRLHRVKVP